MPDERTPSLPGDLEARFDGIENRLSRIEGLLEGFKLAFDQMDKRLTTMQWMIGLLVASNVLILGKLFLK
jgi:hypothetical protein